MTIDRVFIVVMTLWGLILGGVLVIVPQSRTLGIPPYFGVLLVMAIFEAAAFARGRGATGSVIAMQTRLIGFVLAILLMWAVPYLAGEALPGLF